MDELIPAWIEKHRAGRSCKCMLSPLDERPITLELLGRKNLVGFSLFFLEEES